MRAFSLAMLAVTLLPSQGQGGTRLVTIGQLNKKNHFVSFHLGKDGPVPPKEWATGFGVSATGEAVPLRLHDLSAVQYDPVTKQIRVINGNWKKMTFHDKLNHQGAEKPHSIVAEFELEGQEVIQIYKVGDGNYLGIHPASNPWDEPSDKATHPKTGEPLLSNQAGSGA